MTALAGCFKENHCRGRRDVKGADTSGHGNPQQVIAGSAHQIMKSRAFPAEYENTIAGEIEVVVIGLAALIQSNDPQIALLEIFQRAHQIDHPRDAQMLRRAGAGLHRRRAERGRSPLGENHAIDAGSVGDTQQCAEILRVFNAVHRENEARLRGFRDRIRLKEILYGKKLLRANHGYHALVSVRSSREGQLLTRLAAYANSGLPALGREVLQPLVLPLAGDQHLVNAALASAQRLLDRVQAIKYFHTFHFRGFPVLRG